MTSRMHSWNMKSSFSRLHLAINLRLNFLYYVLLFIAWKEHFGIFEKIGIHTETNKETDINRDNFD